MGGAALALLGSLSPARAQEPPAPPTRALELAAGISFGLPQGQWTDPDENGAAELSPGLRLAVGYRATALFTPGAFFRSTLVQRGDPFPDPAGSAGSGTIGSYDVGVFLRFRHAFHRSFDVFADAELFLASLWSRFDRAQDAPAYAVNENGAGVGLRAGGAIHVSRRVSLVASLGWNAFAVSDNRGENEVNAGWLALAAEIWLAF